MQPAVTAVRRGEAEERERSAQNSEVNAVAAAAVVELSELVWLVYDVEANKCAYGEVARLGVNARAPTRACVCVA